MVSNYKRSLARSNLTTLKYMLPSQKSANEMMAISADQNTDQCGPSHPNEQIPCQPLVACLTLLDLVHIT